MGLVVEAPGKRRRQTRAGWMLGLKALLVSWISRPAFGRFIRAIGRGRVRSLRFPALSVDVRSPLISDRSVALIFWGVYESAEVRFISAFLRRDLDAIELGSSIGFVSSAIARRLAPGRRFIAVEANPGLLGVLERNLAHNAAHLRARAVHRAVGYGSEKVAFLTSEENTGGRVSDASVEGAGASDARVQHVDSSGLADLLREFDYGDDYVLVADIEGSEAEVLRHDADALHRCRQLILELHSNRGAAPLDSVEGMVESLTSDHGFELRARRGPVCVFERPS